MGYVKLFPAKINIIFGVSTSNNAGISKFYAEKQAALHSLTFTQVRSSLSEKMLIQILNSFWDLYLVAFFVLVAPPDDEKCYAHGVERAMRPFPPL